MSEPLKYLIETNYVNGDEFRIDGGIIGGIQMTVPADDNDKMTLTQAAANIPEFRTNYLPAQNAVAGAGASAGASAGGVAVVTKGGKGKQTKQRRMQRRLKQSRKKSKRGLKK